MKLAYAALAAIPYAGFAIFGATVWYTLLFVDLPPNATPLNTLQQALLLQPEGHYLEKFAAATAVSAVFAVLLFFSPLVRAHLGSVVVAVAFAAVAWLLFPPDLAVMPTVSAALLVFGWYKSSHHGPGDA